jgi:glycosyltransferase involved in cell wall biosynthesis
MASRYELISIIVPALNERQTLRQLYERVAAAIGPEQPFEFIVIDDGSNDGSFELLEQMHREHPNILAIRHSRPHGKSMALMQGFDEARGDIAFTIDADLQDLPEAIPLFLDKLDEGFDLVNGRRQERQDLALKLKVSKLFNLLTKHLLRCPLNDINCGFKVMRRSLYKQLNLNGDLHRLIPAIAVSRGFKVAEVSIPHAARAFGKSRYRLFRHRGLLDILILLITNTTKTRPFHVFCEIAIIFWLLVFVCLGGFITAEYIYPRPNAIRPISLLTVTLGGWALLMGSLLPVFGLYLDILSRWFQGPQWRHNLIQKKIGG